MYNLNLLDQDRKVLLHEAVRARSVTQFFVRLLLILVVQTAILFGVNGYLRAHRHSIEETITAARAASPTGTPLRSVSESAKELNARLRSLAPFLTDRGLDTLLVDISSQLPSGIRLTELSVSVKSSELSAVGYAATRNDIPALEDSLKKNSSLTNISMQSNINERTNIRFELTAQLSPQRQPGT